MKMMMAMMSDHCGPKQVCRPYTCTVIIITMDRYSTFCISCMMIILCSDAAPLEEGEFMSDEFMMKIETEALLIPMTALSDETLIGEGIIIITTCV